MAIKRKPINVCETLQKQLKMISLFSNLSMSQIVEHYVSIGLKNHPKVKGTLRIKDYVSVENRISSHMKLEEINGIK